MSDPNALGALVARALAEELGMEPAWFLQQLQRAILSSASPQPQMLAGGMPYETAG